MSEVSALLNLTHQPLNANQKLEALKLAILHLKKLDTDEENNLLQRSSSFIVSAFSTAVTISGFAVLPPVFGGALISVCVVCAGGTLVTLAHDLVRNNGSDEKLKVLRTVLGTKDIKKWAQLWAMTDTPMFLTALEYACLGQVETVNGQEVFFHYDRKHPFDVAHAWITSTQTQDHDSPATLTLPKVSSQPPTEKGDAFEEAIIQSPLPPAGEPSRQSVKDEPQPTALTPPLNLLPQAPDFEDLRQLPLPERAIALLNALSDAGLDLSRAIADQITCICGNQRGGKGTLMAILAILSCAIDPKTKVHYFTAGDDVYPFRCDKLYCRLTYPNDDGETADAKVASELYGYLKVMDNGTQGEYQDIILVIDEAVALSDYLDADQKQWMVRFLLTRANKKGAQIFIVLHGVNLTSWVGTGNAGGFSQTFKTGATFIGCEATSKKINPLRSISVATGRYFIANPDDFSKSVEGGDLGTVPEWLKTELNPSTGQPDPARTVLKFFPELRSNSSVSPLKLNDSINPPTSTEKQMWDRFVLESTDDEINDLIERKRTLPVSDSSDTADTPNPPKDDPTDNVSEPGYVEGYTFEDSNDTPDTPDTDTYSDTYRAENFAKDFPEWREEDMFKRISDTTLPPGRFVKEELKATNGEKNKLTRKAVGYLVRKYGDFRLMEKFREYL